MLGGGKKQRNKETKIAGGIYLQQQATTSISKL
jgi:hypothetical protein